MQITESINKDFVYFVKSDEDGEWWEAPDEMQVFSNRWKIRQCPRPIVNVEDTVFVPTRFWYEKDTIKEVEPLFSSRSGEFTRYVYWCRGPGGEMIGKDHFLTRREAIKCMLSLLWRDIKYYFGG